jgi:hypothetical protein
VPQLEFTGAHPRETIADGFSPRGLGRVFLDPRQAFLYRATRDVIIPSTYESARTVPNDVAVPLTRQLMDLGFHEAWHEYGCYITLPAFALAALGIVATWRRHWPLYLAGAVAVLAALGIGSPIDVWSRLQSLPLYGSLHMPSRCLAAVVFVLAVAAAHGVGWLSERLLRAHWNWSMPCSALVAYGTTAAVFAELTVLGWTLFSDIFICDPRAPDAAGLRIVPARAFAVRMAESRFYYPVMTSCVYPRLMSNSGVLQGYENLSVPRGDVRTTRDRDYRGEIYLLGDQGTVHLRRWTMSRVTADLAVGGSDRLVLNQNFSPGWRARIHGADAVRELPAEPAPSGLVSVTVGPDVHRVELYYRPQSLIWGAGVSGLAVIAATAALAIALWRDRRQRMRGGPAT